MKCVSVWGGFGQRRDGVEIPSCNDMVLYLHSARSGIRYGSTRLHAALFRADACRGGVYVSFLCLAGILTLG